MRACPNHVYPVKHKLKNCGMMNNFMISGSLTRDMELEEHQDRRDVMPFPEEDAVMTVYEGGGGTTCPTYVPGSQLIVVENPGTQGCKSTSFPIYISI
jgi:hypothetical protein